MTYGGPTCTAGVPRAGLSECPPVTDPLTANKACLNAEETGCAGLCALAAGVLNHTLLQHTGHAHPPKTTVHPHGSDGRLLMLDGGHQPIIMPLSGLDVNADTPIVPLNPKLRVVVACAQRRYILLVGVTLEMCCGVVPKHRNSKPVCMDATVTACSHSMPTTFGPEPLEYPASTFEASMAWWNATTRETCSKTPRPQQFGKGVMTLVTGGSGPVNINSFRNHRCYCLHHNMNIHYVQHEFLRGSSLHGMFNKMFSLKHALAAAPLDSWVLWADQDIFFTNISLSLVDVIHKSHAARQHRAPCHVVLSQSLNAGVGLFRKSCWTMRFLDRWLSLRERCSMAPLFDNGPMILAVMAELTEAADDAQRWGADGLPQPAMVPMPGCSRGHAELQIGAKDFAVNASQRGASPICFSPGGFNAGWKPGDLLVHLAGRATHLSVRSCYGAYMALWGSSRSSANDTCATDGPMSPKCRGAFG